MDSLAGINPIPVCTGYGERGQIRVPEGPQVFNHAKPDYIWIDGWAEEDLDVSSLDDLPKAALEFLRLIEKEVGIPVIAISKGRQGDLLWRA
jgi:adenylosuccinate synthase